eukprot:CCRYP_013242-RA/>CCRYP_013242-RA protein AED:0.44 eAED:0.44 QI:0/-1/0/1/-1/0/1/0/30
MDMQFHWLHCCGNKKQCRTYWGAGVPSLVN